MPRIPIASEFYDRAQYGVARSRLVNMFAEQAFQRDRPAVLLPTPGSVQRSQLAQFDGTVRGIYAQDGVNSGNLYVVVGETLIEIDEGTKDVTSRGTIEGTGRVRFSGSIEKLVIVADSKSYELSGGTLTEITNVNFNEAADTDYIDGFHLFVRKDSEELFWADVIDPANPSAVLVFDALNFVSAEGTPDNLVGVLVDKTEVYAFGKETIQIFRNTGNADGQFAATPGAEVARGTFSANSKVLVNNIIYFVGDDSIVYRMSNINLERISKHQIEEIIDGLTVSEKEQISMWHYTQDGHIFVCIDVPGRSTYVFDAMTGLWHERCTFDKDQYEYNCATMFDGNIVCGSRFGPVLADLRTNLATETVYAQASNGDNTAETRTIERFFTAALSLEERGLPIFNLALDIVTGTELGSDTPLVSLRWSDDRGNNWTSWLDRSLGAQGGYSQDVVWTNLGVTQPPMRIFEFRITDAVFTAVESLRFNEGLI